MPKSWSLSITIPWSSAWSKNRMWKPLPSGKHYLNPEYAAERDALIYQVKNILQHQRGNGLKPKTKVWLSIMAYMPNHRGDAINLLDGLADGMKVALAIDDKWFAGSWDWEIDRAKPRIEITVRQ